MLSGLTIGTLTIAPTFDPDVTSYTVTTSNATNKITATCDDSTVEIEIKVNGTEIQNETAASWVSGENTVVVTLTATGGATNVYTVTVTKS